jgi:hypothetical protein
MLKDTEVIDKIISTLETKGEISGTDGTEYKYRNQ